MKRKPLLLTESICDALIVEWKEREKRRDAQDMKNPKEARPFYFSDRYPVVVKLRTSGLVFGFEVLDGKCSDRFFYLNVPTIDQHGVSEKRTAILRSEIEAIGRLGVIGEFPLSLNRESNGTIGDERWMQTYLSRLDVPYLDARLRQLEVVTEPM